MGMLLALCVSGDVCGEGVSWLSTFMVGESWNVVLETTEKPMPSGIRHSDEMKKRIG